MSVSLATVATQFLERQGLAKSTIRSYEGTLLSLLQEYGLQHSQLLAFVMAILQSSPQVIV